MDMAQGLDRVSRARCLQCKYREAKPFTQALALRALIRAESAGTQLSCLQTCTLSIWLASPRPHPEIDKFLAELFELLDLFGTQILMP